MKLKLDKQKVTTLSLKDMSQVNGGGRGERRSNRLHGNCHYSTKHASGTDSGGNAVGCVVDSANHQSTVIASKSIVS
jgi:hypothetical protein